MLPICLYLNYSFVYTQNYSQVSSVTAEALNHQLLVLRLQPAYGLFQVRYFFHKA